MNLLFWKVNFNPFIAFVTRSHFVSPMSIMCPSLHKLLFIFIHRYDLITTSSHKFSLPFFDTTGQAKAFHFIVFYKYIKLYTTSVDTTMENIVFKLKTSSMRSQFWWYVFCLRKDERESGVGYFIEKKTEKTEEFQWANGKKRV